MFLTVSRSLMFLFVLVLIEACGSGLCPLASNGLCHLHSGSGGGSATVVTCSVDTTSFVEPSGSVDTSFGTAGFSSINASGGFGNWFTSMVLQATGKIVLVGYRSNSIQLVRYFADGSQDTSFGTAGVAVTQIGGFNTYGYGAAKQCDGKIVVAGTVSNATGDIALARYSVDGIIDSGFGTSGTVTTDIAGGNDGARAVAVQADGKIVIGGFAGSDMVVARYTSTGA